MALVEIEGFCAEFIHGDSGSDVAQRITDVVLGTGDILPLVQALGIYLTSTNVDTRSCAIKLLSSVLESSSLAEAFPPQDVHYLVQFYCDRLKDHALVLPQVLVGLHALVMGQGLEGGDALLISRSIFKEVYCQSLQYEGRNKIFAVFLSLLTHQLRVFVKCSEEFVLGYVQLVDGERDPRNLLLVFNSVLVIVRNLHFDSLVEDLFDVISCYFPIDFSPPPNDPTSVSRECLVASLGHCLAATPKFAKNCLPLLLEKLSSDVLTAKLDSMSVLALAAPVYGPVAMEPFLHQLWTVIEREMFKVTVPDFQLASVSAVTAIAISFSQPLHTSVLHQFIGYSLQNFQRCLNDPDLKLIKPIVQLLCGIATASDPSAMCVLPQAIPPILKQISLSSLVTHKVILMGEAKSLVDAVTFSQSVQAASPLVGCKGALLDGVQSALTQADVAYKKAAIEIFSSLVFVPSLLTKDEVIFYGQLLRDMIFTSTALQDSVSSALQSVCKAYTELAIEHLISPTLAELNADPSRAWLLVHLSPTPSLAASVLPAMVSVLQCWESKSPNCAYWGKLLPVSTALLNIVKTNAVSAPLTIPSMNHLLLLSQQAADGHWECCSADVSRFVESVSASLSQNTRHASDRWCDEGIQAVVDILVAGPSGTLSSVSPARCLCLPLLTAFLGAAPPLVIAKWGGQLWTPLMELSLRCETSGHAVKAYASMVNKHPEGEEFSGWVSKHLDVLWSSFPSTAFTAEFSGPLTVLIWMTKALIMRSHELGLPAAQKLLELCVRKDCLGEGAADGFKLILLNDKEILNTECHANVKLFYKQRLFLHLLPKLMEMVVEVQEGRKQHLLKCLAHFIVGVPQQVIVGELAKVLPLLLESLCSEDTDVKKSTLNGLLSILTESPQCVSGHVATLLSRLLCLSCDKTSMAIRKVSLQCIEALSSLPTHLIYPHQRQVLKSLALCLDDHKRLVRKAAVDARAKWFLL